MWSFVGLSKKVSPSKLIKGPKIRELRKNWKPNESKLRRKLKCPILVCPINRPNVQWGWYFSPLKVQVRAHEVGHFRVGLGWVQVAASWIDVGFSSGLDWTFRNWDGLGLALDPPFVPNHWCLVIVSRFNWNWFGSHFKRWKQEDDMRILSRFRTWMPRRCRQTHFFYILCRLRILRISYEKERTFWMGPVAIF